MSEICRRYNLSKEQLVAMVRDGRISSTAVRHDEIYTTYKNNLSKSTGVEDAVIKTSIDESVDVRTVYRVIAEFK